MTEAESLEQAIHETISLAPYDPQWAAEFQAERARLLELFTHLLQDVQHVGSTAIPGMPAKPIIDLLGGVESMQVADALVTPLLKSGYTTSAEFNATLSDRRWLMRWRDGRRTHHLHLVVRGGPTWKRYISFRDALRADSHLAQRYAMLKADLVAKHGADREAYTRAKAEFIVAVTGEK